MKEWTIMVYMAGDNNLSIDMAYALKDIREVVKARNDKVNLMVYYDGKSPDTPTVYCDFTDFADPLYVPAYTVEKRYKYSKSRRRNYEENPEDQNAATMYSIMNFVDWCINPKKRDKKADKHALIFSGHGFGFQAISFLKDDSSDYYMTIRKFRASLGKIRDEILSQPINLVGFDCCVMSMLEIGYEIRDCAETMIASEGSIPNAGWTYGNVLGDLVSCTTQPNTQEVAKNFVHSFIDSQKEFAIGGVSVDMSAWDLSKIENVVTAADKLGEILLVTLLKESEIFEPLKSALLYSHWECQSYMFEQNIDLKDFCQRLLKTAADFKGDVKVALEEEKDECSFIEKFKERCQGVIDAVDACVLESGFSGGAYQFSNGISIFFPWTYLTYLFSEKSYKDLKFAYDGGKYWNAFLLHFLRDVTLRGQNVESGKLNPILKFPTSKEEDKISENPANKISENPANKIIENAANKISENPANKIWENPANKISENPANKIWENPANKIIENAANKISENPVNMIMDSSMGRMLGTMGLTLADFKNIATPWNVAGYAKDKPGISSNSNSADGGIKKKSA